MIEQLKLSIVIPTYNNYRLLQRCLRTVALHRPADTETIVVDDGSIEDIRELAAAEFPDVRVLRQTSNGGFCKAANTGLRAATGDIVELLNNDTEVCPGWTDKPLEAFADAKVGAVAPLVCKLPLRHRIDSAGDVYYWIGVAKKRGENQFAEAPFDRPVEVFTASASSAFYRREALLAVGGFPEHFGAYLDDVDLGFRLRLAGYKCLFEPESRVLHWVSRSHPTRSRRIQQQVSRNSEWVFWTNLTNRQLAMLAVPHLAFVLVQLAYKTVRGEFGPWFAGKCAAMGELPTVIDRRRHAQSLCRAGVPGV